MPPPYPAPAGMRWICVDGPSWNLECIPLFEVTDSKGDTTFGLTAEELGAWVRDAMSLRNDHRPVLLSIKHCSIS